MLVKRFDVSSLGWKQAERQTLRYSDDEELLVRGEGGASRGRSYRILARSPP